MSSNMKVGNTKGGKKVVKCDQLQWSKKTGKIAKKCSDLYKLENIVAHVWSEWQDTSYKTSSHFKSN